MRSCFIADSDKQGNGSAHVSAGLEMAQRIGWADQPVLTLRSGARAWGLAIVFLVGALCGNWQAQAATWTVKSASDGMKKGTLRHAVVNAASGDTIVLATGTGKNPIVLNGSEIVLDNYGKDGGGGIWCTETELSVSDCVLEGNDAYLGGGVLAWDSEVTIKSNLISGNHALIFGGGLALPQCSGIVQDCTVTSNTAGDGGADVFLWESDIEFIDTEYDVLLDWAGPS
jgi:hypothetical protein